MPNNYAEVLESYMIPAEEGFFSNLKEKREAKRAEKAKKKAEKAERERLFAITSKEDLQLAKRLCVNIPNKFKSKYKNLPFKIEWYEVDEEIYVSIFEDEWCMNEFHEKYIPEAEKCFDEIVENIEKIINDNKDKFKNTMSVEVEENNVISICVMG